MSKLGTLGRNWGFFPIGNLIDSTAFESHASAWLNHLRSSVVKIKGAQDPGLRITTLVQFCKLSSHWRMNDGSNLSSHWSKNVWF